MSESKLHLIATLKFLPSFLLFISAFLLSNFYKNLTERIVLFLVAGGLSWLVWVGIVRLENSSALKEETAPPVITGKIHLLAIGPAGGDDVDSPDSMVTIGVDLVNKSGPPSAFTDWSLKLVTEEKTVGAEIPSMSRNIRITLLEGQSPKGNERVLESDNYLPRVGFRALPSGALAAGWFCGVFRGISRDALANSTGQLVLRFHDVLTDSEHRISEMIKPPTERPFGMVDVQRPSK